MRSSPKTVPHPVMRLCLLHAVLVGFDHLLDHLTADGTGLTTGELAVVTVLQVDADLSGGPANILKTPRIAVMPVSCR